MKRILSIAIVPLVMLLFYNQVANWHYHKLPSGIVVEHAHPFPKSNTANSPYQSHTHSDFEFLILGLISSTIGLIVLLFIVPTLAIPYFIARYSHYLNNYIPTGYLPTINPHRGPPSYPKK